MWLFDDKEIVDYFIIEFKQLYTSSRPHILDRLEGLGEEEVTVDENLSLIELPIEK